VPVMALGLVPLIDAVAVRVSALERGWKAALMVVLVVLFGYEAWAGRSAIVAEDFSKTPALWASIGEAIPANAEVIALTQDYGFDLMYWGWRRVDLWPLATDLAAVRNSDRDLAARFQAITAGKDLFLVTAFGQLDGQPELKKILNGYTVAVQGDGYVLYDLHRPK